MSALGAKARRAVIPPPRPLRNKVSPGGPSLAEIVERAETALARMTDEYAETAREDLAELDAALAAIKAAASDAVRAEALGRVYRLAHEMRTQGGTFDYPLITRIGSSLCAFIEAHGDKAAERWEVIETHGYAMRAVLAGRVTGYGGKIGRELVADIEAMVAKAVARMAKTDT